MAASLPGRRESKPPGARLAIGGTQAAPRFY
jgi:hypothetical protein